MAARPTPGTRRSITASTIFKLTRSRQHRRVGEFAQSPVKLPPFGFLSRELGDAARLCRAAATKRQASVPVIKLIAAADPVLWNVDADRYTESNIRRLLGAGDTLRQAWPGMSDILVTLHALSRLHGAIGSGRSNLSLVPAARSFYDSLPTQLWASRKKRRRRPRVLCVPSVAVTPGPTPSRSATRPAC